MTTHLLIPTPHELDQLPDLSTFLRPMEPQPKFPPQFRWEKEPELCSDGLWRGRYWYLKADGSDQGMQMGGTFEAKPPFAPGNEIAWGEEWWERRLLSGGIERRLLQPENMSNLCPWKHQPAATMPVALARYRSVVVECRPVKVVSLDWVGLSQLGLETKHYEWNTDIRHRFCKTWPDIPLDSWVWQIDLKGKP